MCSRGCAWHHVTSAYGVRLQRSEVVIDACMLSGSESTFLQQATHLTGGIYLRPRLRGALLQYLLVCFL